MIRASLYVIGCSARNRFRSRLRRLREPRYWLGAIAALAYLYFSLFGVRDRGRPASSRRRGAGAPAAIVGAVTASGPILTASLLALATAVAWVVPVGAGVLEFSRAEIQFLFPAPVDRRWLLVHSLMRSQLGLLLASLVPAVVFASGGVASRVRLAVSMWIVLVTLRLYFTGVSLARPRLAHPERRARWTARAPLVLSVGVAVVAASVLVREFAGRPILRWETLLRLASFDRDGMLSWALAPFLAVVRPAFAADGRGYLAVLPGALAVLGVTLLWVLQSDRAFEAAADAVVAGYDERQSTLTRQRYRLRAAPWRLALRGGIEGALVWKAATESVRLFRAQALLWFLLPFGPFVVVGSLAGAFPNGFVQVVAVTALAIAGFTTAMGPQIVRSDLRRDLVHLDLLKTWPVKPGSLIRGSLLWPAVQLTAVVWLSIGASALLAPRAFPDVETARRLALAGAAVVLAPALVVAQLVIHNGVALLFPGWVSLGGHRPRGLDATGQRLITLGGSWLALALMAGPAAAVGGGVWLVLAPWLGRMALFAAASTCAVVLTLEAYLLTEALSPLFERMDLTDVERAE